MTLKSKKIIYITLCFLCLISLLYFLSSVVLSSIGSFLVADDAPYKADAIVVLNTGMEYYPRLIEAASLYKEGYAKKIVINGNRKTEALRELEKKGFVHCCLWYEERLRILELYNVSRDDVITISAEDVYDTVGEARIVGEEIIKTGISSVIITTSKSHTRRACHIWENIWSNQLKIKMVSAKDDPYDPEGWWKSGRQIKWVLSEYGAWIFYYWKKIAEI